MNNKHLACAIVIVCIALLVQATLWMNKRMIKMKVEADSAKSSVASSTVQLQVQRAQFSELEKNSKAIIEYLNIWQPYFGAVDSAQAAELKISLKIKQDNLVSLSQRYEVVGNPNNSFLPDLVRAHLTFEDNYARLLNWFGQIESQLPTLRTAGVRLSRGTSEEDLKMELILEQPLAKAR